MNVAYHDLLPNCAYIKRNMTNIEELIWNTITNNAKKKFDYKNFKSVQCLKLEKRTLSRKLR